MTYERDTGMKLDMDKCDMDVTNKTEIHKFPIKEGCSCNSCETACKFDNKFKMNPLQGFNAWIVVTFYLFVILASIIITYCKKYYRKGKKSYDDISRGNSMDFGGLKPNENLNNNTKVYPINEKSNQTNQTN